MPLHNEDIASIFEEIADLLDIQGDNPFRIRAYRNAARSLALVPYDIAEKILAGEPLPPIPGIGKDLDAKIHEIVTTGRCRTLEKLRKKLPHGLVELLAIPGLGPKRVRALWQELDIHDPQQLARAAREHRVRELPGFAAKTEEKILAAIETRLSGERRYRRDVATRIAGPLVAFLRGLAGVKAVEIAGSYRRGRETVGDLDILVAATDGRMLLDQLGEYDEVATVSASGSTRATLRLKIGMQVDIRVVPPESYGAALHYFTGSKAHNIAVRRLGQQRGLRINEYGVFRGGQRVGGETEESVFAAVGLPWLPPELREDRGELEAARAGLLPRLVAREDLRGDLHAHTDATDGRNSLAEMAEAARQRGLEYLAITDHSQRLTVARGLDAARLLRQGEAIDALNERLHGITLLKGIEVDILEDGGLDMPDEVLAHLDLIVAAVHSHFSLPRRKQTDRILRAMDNPYLTILAHPTGRLLGEREAMDIDLGRIVHHARERGCFLELDADPRRLDLTDVACRMAKDDGVLVAISSDAHTVTGLDNLDYGITQARRGWLGPEDVLNTRPLPELMKRLRAVRSGA